MKRALFALTVLACLTSGVAAQQTWTGVISDNSCKGKHEAGGEAGLPEGDHECTLACIRGGSKFVLVSEGKMYLIAKQDDPKLLELAGAKVKIAGDLKDDVLTIASIEKVK